MNIYISHNQKRRTPKNSKGFTLVETLVAIFILLLTITTMITLSAGSFYNVRYAQNQITANMLAQEMIEYIRYTRDTAVQKDSINGFTNWVDSAGVCQSRGDTGYCDINQFLGNSEIINFAGQLIPQNDCVPGTRGCQILTPTFIKPQQLLRYPKGQFINSSEYISGVDTGGPPSVSLFSRGVQFNIHSPDQVEVTVRIDWKNGAFDRSVKESIILTRW